MAVLRKMVLEEGRNRVGIEVQSSGGFYRDYRI